MKRIYIEGIAGSGKTTLSRALLEEGYPVVPEIGKYFGLSELREEGRNLEEINRIIEWFVHHEKQRLSQEGIFDRSFLLHLAFYYAYEKFSGIKGSFNLCIEKYEGYVKRGELALPSSMVFLDVPFDFALNNLKKRERNGFNKLSKLWYRQNALEDVRKAYKTMVSANSTQSLMLNSTNLQENKEQLIKCWNSIGSKKSPESF